ncbi:hypothetical protein [Streptomyces sp. NPDC002853]
MAHEVDSLAAEGDPAARRVLLTDFDGVPGAGELPAVGAFADVLDDDVVDEVVLELVVGEFPGEPEFLDLVPVAPAAVDAQGRGGPGAARAFVVAGFDVAADLELALFEVGGDRSLSAAPSTPSPTRTGKEPVCSQTSLALLLTPSTALTCWPAPVWQVEPSPSRMRFQVGSPSGGSATNSS